MRGSGWAAALTCDGSGSAGLAWGASTWLPLPSTSMRISSLPTAITSPGWPPRANTLPLTGEGISTVALSVMTSATTWSSAIMSPTLTNHSTNSTCAMPSPMSGILMTCVPIQTSMTFFNAAPTREGPGK